MSAKQEMKEMQVAIETASSRPEVQEPDASPEVPGAAGAGPFAGRERALGFVRAWNEAVGILIQEHMEGRNPSAGQIFRWTDTESGETRSWPVPNALAFVQCRRNSGNGRVHETKLTLGDVKESLKHNYEVPFLDPARVAAADLSYPVIAVTLLNEQTGREESMIIDGWHRMVKFANQGDDKACLPVLILNRFESELIEGERCKLFRAAMELKERGLL